MEPKVWRRAVAANDHLTWEILTRLPSKSVVRFRAACKRWLSLVSGPHFITNHTLRRARDPHAVTGFILHTDFMPITCSFDGPSSTLLPDPSLSFITNRPVDTIRFSIMGNCNGLILCDVGDRRAIYGTSDLWEPDLLYLCNPTTMEIQAIPNPTSRVSNGAGLAFNPLRSLHYQVVLIGYRPELEYTGKWEFEMYDSDTGKWEYTGQLPSCPSFFSYNGVFWNGMVNWATDNEGSLVSFDVERRRLLPIMAAPFPCEVNILYFGESGGRLHLIKVDNPCRQRFFDPSTSFDIMEMAGDLSGWSLLHRVDLSGMEKLYPEIYVDQYHFLRDAMVEKSLELWPVFVVRGEADEEDELVLSMTEKIVSYSLRNKSFRLIETVPAQSGPWEWNRGFRPYEVFPYSPTLLSLSYIHSAPANHGTGREEPSV